MSTDSDEICPGCKCEHCENRLEHAGTVCWVCSPMRKFLNSVKVVIGQKKLPYKAIVEKYPMYKFQDEIR